MKLEAFVVRYYLPNQSELFSEPQVYIAKTWQDLVFAINTAQKNNYEIVGIDAAVKDENGVEVVTW